MSTTELTAARLRELLDYDPITGAFTWRSPRQSGYRRIFIDGRLYAASRLAWLWMTGSWPKGQIDHANLKKDDDRWTNLREASQSAQSANRGRLRKNKVGLKGVTYEKRKFRAQRRTISSITWAISALPKKPMPRMSRRRSGSTASSHGVGDLYVNAEWCTRRGNGSECTGPIGHNGKTRQTPYRHQIRGEWPRYL
jgi:HNH endonuclease